MRFTREDEQTIKELGRKARALRATRQIVGEGICQERATAALDEAAAILEDAVENCRLLPSIPSVREDAGLA